MRKNKNKKKIRIKKIRIELNEFSVRFLNKFNEIADRFLGKSQKLLMELKGYPKRYKSFQSFLIDLKINYKYYRTKIVMKEKIID